MPIVAKIKPTSPRGIMPRPINKRSDPERPAPRPAVTLVTTAITMRIAATPRTDGRNIEPMSVSMPICRKKTGTNTDASAETSRATRSWPGERPTAVPATKAPMIGARCAASATPENASAAPIASTDTAAGDVALRRAKPRMRGNARKPTVVEMARNDSAKADVDAMVPTPTEPFSTMRVTIVRMMSPSTSSATAAPSTMRASRVDRARRSPKTRAVMPTLVAVRVAPMKRAVLPSSPSARPARLPKTSGSVTPTTATVSAARPTRRNSATSISMPTCINKRIAPSSASTKSESDRSTRPRADGPMMTPARISPRTAGTPTRSASSATTFAAHRMSASSRRSFPRSTPVDAPAARTIDAVTTKSQAGRAPSPPPRAATSTRADGW